MHLTLLVVFATSLSLGFAINVNTKLDFDDTLEKISAHKVPTRKSLIGRNPKKTEITCSTNGCNQTSANANEVINLETDVIVEVKNTVDIKNQTKKIEDVPDVPVVLGVNGLGSKNNYQPGLQYHSVARNFDRNLPPLQVTNIEKAFPFLIPSDSQTRNLPSVSIVKVDELKIPYFEPAYHNHYYGEYSPPQVAYYSRKGSGVNPVAFNYRPQVTPTLWNTKYPSTSNHRSDSNNCKCQEQKISGLRWYPSQARSNVNFEHQQFQGNIGDPGVSIDDKLAPLD